MRILSKRRGWPCEPARLHRRSRRQNRPAPRTGRRSALDPARRPAAGAARRCGRWRGRPGRSCWCSPSPPSSRCPQPAGRALAQPLRRSTCRAAWPCCSSTSLLVLVLLGVGRAARQPRRRPGPVLPADVPAPRRRRQQVARRPAELARRQRHQHRDHQPGPRPRCRRCRTTCPQGTGDIVSFGPRPPRPRWSRRASALMLVARDLDLHAALRPSDRRLRALGACRRATARPRTTTRGGSRGRCRYVRGQLLFSLIMGIERRRGACGSSAWSGSSPTASATPCSSGSSSGSWS